MASGDPGGPPGPPGPLGPSFAYSKILDMPDMHFDPLLVCLSVMVASVGAFTTLTTVSYLFRVKKWKWYLAMLVQCGLGLGVSTVWTLHFIGMRAIRLVGLDSGAIEFDTGLTLLSAGSSWMFSTFAIHVLKSKERSPRQSLVVAASLLTFGIGSMHYAGVVAERGLFNPTLDVGMLLIHLPIVIICCTLMALLLSNLQTSMIFRCLACISIAGLTAIVHYVGMMPVSHNHFPRGSTWQFLPLSPTKVSAEACVIVSLFCDVLLMASNSFYLEVIQVQEKTEISKELEHRKYVAESLPLMKRCQSMQFPMTLVPARVFLEQGRLVQHELLRDQHLLVMLDSTKNAADWFLKNGGYIIFFSHQWLSRTYPDPTGSQFRDMAFAVEEIARQQRLEVESSPQQQQLAINSLPAYVATCNAFVIVATAETHLDSREICNFYSYSTRFWCRLEVLCATMTTMNHLEEMQEEQRLYMVAQQQLDSMHFLDEHGVKPEYTDLFHVYRGSTNCCDCNHCLPNGLSIECDKHRVATTLVGLYGTMLVQAMRLRESRQLSGDQQTFLDLCEMLIDERQKLFPAEFFSTRIEAVHQYLDEVCRVFGRPRGSRGQHLRAAVAASPTTFGWRMTSASSSLHSMSMPQEFVSPTSPTAENSTDSPVEMMNLEDLSAELCRRAHHRAEMGRDISAFSVDSEVPDFAILCDRI